MRTWKPPTVAPEVGQGPWCDPLFGRWWVVANSPDQALAAVAACDADVFPSYFGWKAKVEPVAIQWVDPLDWNEEAEVMEVKYYDEERTAKAWRITVENT